MCPNMSLSMFVKGKVDFKHVKIWLWVYLWKENLTLDMSKYNFEYDNERKVNFGHIQIQLWVCVSKENLTLDMPKW
jgi:hypothetical protein